MIILKRLNFWMGWLGALLVSLHTFAEVPIITQLVVNDYANCALNNTGGVKCWGRNDSGQLGDGTTIDRSTPVDVIGLNSGVIGLSMISANDANRVRFCALTIAGGVMCWGSDGTSDFATAQSTPVDISGLTYDVKAIYLGLLHACALTTSGGVKCWGNNVTGQLGDGTTTSRSQAVNVVGLSSNVQTIETGVYYTCALTASGGVKCWGENYDGQLGDNSTDYYKTTPVDVEGLTSNVQAIQVGDFHACALTTLGGVKCWGTNEYGLLGDGTTIDRFTPVDVVGLTSDVQAIKLNDEYACALTTLGGVKCWGRNYLGQLGDGTTIYRSTPVDVVGLTSGVKAIEVGHSRACALTTVGGVKCWGDNNEGQLGDGTRTNRYTPVNVAGLTSGVTAIQMGTAHTCALTITGGVICWGDNIFGETGDGMHGGYEFKPVYVKGLSGILTKTIQSSDTKDGWILESTETSNKGGKADISSSTLIIGDSLKNQEYRSILHFDTASLPDNAVITKAMLTLKKQSLKGDVKPLGNLVVDMKQKNFGTSASLAANDFEATAGKISVGTFKASGSTYSASLTSTGKSHISKTAATQFKIHFTKDDNNDKGDDYLKFYSGNAQASSRPSLQIEYYVP